MATTDDDNVVGSVVGKKVVENSRLVYYINTFDMRV